MRRSPASFDTTVSAFRDMTALPAAGAVTRARVLEKASQQARRHAFWRRAALALGMVLAVSSTASALTAAALRWRAPPPTRIEKAEAAPARAAVARRPTRVVPMIAAETIPSRRREPDGGERRAYEQAHRAHFFADAPALALLAWDQYLAAYPRWTFAPEARYNRALCLVRLRKLAAAAQALRPFTTGHPDGYRHREACLLLRWLSDNGAPARAETTCAASN